MNSKLSMAVLLATIAGFGLAGCEQEPETGEGAAFEEQPDTGTQDQYGGGMEGQQDGGMGGQEGAQDQPPAGGTADQ